MTSPQPSRLGAVAAFVARRGELGLSQAGVARKAGVSERAVSGFESEGIWPIPRTRAKLERAVGWENGEIARLAAASADEPGLKYRRTIEEDARQFPPLSEDWHRLAPLSLEELAAWCDGQLFEPPDGEPYIVIGDDRAGPRDWIVKRAPRRFEVVKPEDFERDRERVAS